MQFPDLNNPILQSGSLLVLGNFLLNHAKALPLKLWNVFLRRFSVTMEVPENRAGFDLIKKFMTTQKYIGSMRNVSLLYEGENEGRYVWRYPASPGSRFFWFEGKPASYSLYRRELDGGGSFAIFDSIFIRFYFGNGETYDRFMRAAEDFEKQPKESKSLTINSWNFSHWEVVTRQKRSLDSIVLPDGKLEDLVNFISKFLESKSFYRERGIPYHLGIMLYGPPGNGKTSLIKALASHFDHSISVVPITREGLDDTTIVNLFSYLPDRTFAIVEDIDCIFESPRVLNGKSRLTLSGLLNAMDGVASKEGYILFFTTNHPERLDPALKRPGRIDLQFHIGNVSPEQAEAYFNKFYGPGHQSLASIFSKGVGNANLSMAELQQHFLQYPEADLAASSQIMRSTGRHSAVVDYDMGEAVNDQESNQRRSIRQ